MSRTRRKRWKILGVTVAILFCLVVGVGMSNGSRIMTTVGGREILGVTRNIFTEGVLSHDGTITTLQLGASRATVTADAVVLSDGTSLPIPEACRRIEVRARRDRLHVLFDGNEAN